MKLELLDKFYKKQSLFYDMTRWVFLFDRKEGVEMLGVKEGDLVFDFACGTGANIGPLLANNARVIGVDYSKYMLDIARHKYPSVTFKQQDITRYASPIKADGIMCSYGLSITEEWEEAILNMKKLIKPDGKVVIVDFYHSWRGVIKILQQPFFRHMHKFGVIPEKRIDVYLKKHFADVKIIVRHSGYDFIALATNPF